MLEPTDIRLLSDYAERDDQDAFREIVSRHAGMVYSAALRHLGTSDLAKDVAQSVFSDLAKQAGAIAGRLRSGASLCGWLYQSARYAALNERRRERRRAARERDAMERMQDSAEGAGDWKVIAPVLDEAMEELQAEDRGVLLLRFFRRLDLRAVGEELGISDDAAQKRVSRAIERLREGLSKRGFKVAAGGLALSLKQNALQATPIGFESMVSNWAMLAGSTSSAGLATATTIATSVGQRLALAAAVCMAVAVGTVGSISLSRKRREARTLRDSLQSLSLRLEQIQSELTESTNRLAAISRRAADADRYQKDLEALQESMMRLRAEPRQGKEARQDLQASSEEAAWLRRVAELKARVATGPESRLPEAVLLQSEDWLNAARQNFDTEEEVQSALGRLRSNGERRFLDLAHRALVKFLEANHNEFPPDVESLVPYFETPIPDDVIGRYHVTASAQPYQSGDKAPHLAITLKSPDSPAVWTLNSNGVSGGNAETSQEMDMLAPAMKALFEATPEVNGRRVVSLEQLRDYVSTPEQKAALEKLMQLKNSGTPSAR